MFTRESNKKELYKVVSDLVNVSDKHKFILIDGDRTLSPVDATKSFLKYANIDEMTLEACFETTHYSFDMFLKAAELYSQIPPNDYLSYCEQATQEIELHAELIAFIQHAAPYAQIIVITAGGRMLWERILEKHNLRSHLLLIGGNHFHFDK